MTHSDSRPICWPAALLTLLACAAFGVATFWFITTHPSLQASFRDPSIPVRGDGVSSRKLSNGFEVIVVERPSTPIASSILIVGAGGAHDPLDRRGLAHLFEHMQFLEDFMDDMSWLAAHYNAFTATTQTTYHADVHAEQLEALAWAEAKRFVHPVIGEEEIADERPVVLAEWGIANDTTGDAKLTDVFAIAWPGHDYGSPVIGVRSEFDAITADDVRQFWSRYYVPSNALWIVVGGVEAERVFALAEKYFGWIPAGRPADPIPPPTFVHPRREEGTPIVLESAEDRNSLVFVMTCDPTEDDVPAMIAATALSDDRASLPARLREEFGDGATFDYGAEFLAGSCAFVLIAEVEPWPGVEAVRACMNAEIARVFDRGLDPAADRRTRELMQVEGLAYDHPAMLAEHIARLRAAEIEIDLRTSAEVLADFPPERVLASTRTIAARGTWIHFSPESTARAPVIATSERWQAERGTTEAAEERREPLPWPLRFSSEIPIDPKPPRVRPLESETISVPLGPAGEAKALDVLLRHEADAPRVALWARIARGCAHDPADALGLATIAAAATLPDPDFAVVDYFPGVEETLISVSVAKHDTARGVELLADWLRLRTIPRDRIALAIERVELGNDTDFFDFSTLGLMRLSEAILGDPRFSPYLGEHFDRGAITPEKVEQWWAESVTPRHTTLVIGGAFDEPALRSLLAEHFEGWTHEGPDSFEAPPTPTSVERQIILLPREGEHLQVAVGFPAPAGTDRRRALLEEWATYLSDSTEKTMRRERNFSYGPTAGYAPFRTAGFAWMSFDLPEDSLLEALGALEGIFRTQVLPILYEGRQPDRAMQETYLARGQSSLDQRLHRVLHELREPTLPPIEELIRRQVPAESLAETASSVIDRDQMVWVITGPISPETEAALESEYDGVRLLKE